MLVLGRSGCDSAGFATAPLNMLWVAEKGTRKIVVKSVSAHSASHLSGRACSWDQPQDGHTDGCSGHRITEVGNDFLVYPAQSSTYHQ